MWDYHTAIELSDLTARDGIADLRSGSRTHQAIGALGVPLRSNGLKPWPRKRLNTRTLTRTERKRRFWRRNMGLAAGIVLGLPTLATAVSVYGAIDRGRWPEEMGEVATAMGIFYGATIAFFILLTPLWLRQYRDRVTRVEEADTAVSLDASGLAVTREGRTVLAGSWAELALADLQVLEEVTEGGTQKSVYAATLKDAQGRQSTVQRMAFDRGHKLLKEILWALADHGRLGVDGSTWVSGIGTATARKPGDWFAAVAPWQRILIVVFVVAVCIYALVAVNRPRPILRIDYQGDIDLLANLADATNSLIDARENEQTAEISDLCRADFFYDATRRVSIPQDDEAALAHAIDIRDSAFSAISRIAGDAGYDWEEENRDLCGPAPFFYRGGGDDVITFLNTANRMIFATRLGEELGRQDVCNAIFQYMDATVASMNVRIRTMTLAESVEVQASISAARTALDWIAEQHDTTITGLMADRCG